MKSLLRPGVLVTLLAAVLLAATGVAAYWLARLGSGALAATVMVAGVAAVLVVAVAWALARDAEAQLGEVLPPTPMPPAPRAATVPAGKNGFKVREARPGEVPEAYLEAVRRGAQARQAAWRASDRPSDPHVS